MRSNLAGARSASSASPSARRSLSWSRKNAASGCKLLLSLTSSGQITSSGPTPYFIVIDRALRDEGASYHYAAPSEFADADLALVARAKAALRQSNKEFFVGATWTTDAPFRETAEAIKAARAKNILAVEMEAAALYTFARATGFQVLCLAHVTNTMGQTGHDFEKGEADGTADSLIILEALVGIAREDPIRLPGSGCVLVRLLRTPTTFKGRLLSILPGSG